MGVKEKIFSIIFIIVVAVCACFCIGFHNKNENTEFKPLYIDEAGICVAYKSKNKPKFCQIQFFESLDELKDNSRIYVLPNVKIDNQLIDFLRSKGYDFHIENTESTIIIKIGQKEKQYPNENGESK